MLTSSLILTHCDSRLPLIMAAYASEHGTGSVVFHKFPDGSQEAVSHASQALTKAERHYSPLEKR